MGGHSHWAGIKHKKAAQDTKRGKIFTRLIREITISARLGGGNPDNNPRLRKAIEDGKAANMPQGNVKKAIQRGTGELPGASYEELTYEGYGPGGIAILVEIITDSKNRTHNEIRKIFSEHGGNLGEAGCVGWMFKQKGYITVKKSEIGEDEIMNMALELGVDDFKTHEADVYEITTSPQDFESVRQGLAEKNVPLDSAEVTLLPTTEVPVKEADAPKAVQLLESLEDHDDSKNVYSNFDISDEVLSQIEH